VSQTIRAKEEGQIVDPVELLQLIKEGESDRIEFKQSMSDGDRIREAICSFANDLPNHKKPGYVFVGVADKGEIVGLADPKRALHTLADYKDSGNILPVPRMITGQTEIEGKAIVFAQVFSPSIESSNRQQRTPERYVSLGCWSKLGGNQQSSSAFGRLSIGSLGG
jgi:predicted HTH transcriptional regulator